MSEGNCFFSNLNIRDSFPQSPSDTKHVTSLKQQLAGTVAAPSDMRSRKSFIVKAHDYDLYGADSSICVAIMVACMSAYKNWEGYYFNYLTVTRDENLELLTIDHDEGFDNVDPDDICALYAHVLLLAMTRHFLDEEHAIELFESVLAEHKQHSELLTYLGPKLLCPYTWIRGIKEQMDILPKLKTAVTRFLIASPDRRCKQILYELRGAEMATFKACLYFTYHAPKTAAHVQKYILREMLLLRKHVTKIKSLSKDERDLVALLYPGEYLPPINVYSNLAFCTVYQYRRGEALSEAIDCPHKAELKVLVRTKLKGPLNLSNLTPVERNMLAEIDVTDYFQEESGPLLVDYDAPRLNQMLKTVVAEMCVPPKDPVDIIDHIVL